MKVARPLLACLPVFFLSGAVVMLFFVHLAGITRHNPLNRIFFLQADTRGIPNAPPRAQWTLYNICDSSHGRNIHCSGRHAATPMLPQQNFRTHHNIPHQFLHRPNKFYYLSRFFYAFSIISLFFVLCALGLSCLAFCSYLGAAMAGAMACWALFLQTFTTCIMTAVYTMGKNAFRDAGRDANVGAKAFAFMWTSLFLIFISSILLWMGYLLGHHKRDIRKRYERNTNGNNGNRGGIRQPGMVVMGAHDNRYALNSGSGPGQEPEEGMSTSSMRNGLTPAKPFNKRRHRLSSNYARGGFFRPGPPGAPEYDEKAYRRSADSGYNERQGLVSRGTETGTGTDSDVYSPYSPGGDSRGLGTYRYGNTNPTRPGVIEPHQAEYGVVDSQAHSQHATVLSPTQEVEEGTGAYGAAPQYSPMGRDVSMSPVPVERGHMMGQMMGDEGGYEGEQDLTVVGQSGEEKLERVPTHDYVV